MVAPVFGARQGEGVLGVSSPTLPSPAMVAAATSDSLLLAGMSPWDFTRVLSPRTHVKAALPGSDANGYPRSCALDGEAPAEPWVIYLGDLAPNGEYAFRLLCFDFDVKYKVDDSDQEQARKLHAAHTDAADLRNLLEDLHLPYLLCESGPSQGRHVWLRLDYFAPKTDVDPLVRAAKRWLPSLDLSPVTNPKEGGVRAPGAPHRHGGFSLPIGGDAIALRDHGISISDFKALSAALHLRAPAPNTTAAKPLAIVDVDGTKRLDVRRRRKLPPRSQYNLDTAVTFDEDASSHMWVALLGMASSGWSKSDCYNLIDHAPGLEYLRTKRGASSRIPRRPGEQARLLDSEWNRAVQYVATHPLTPAHDDDFDRRAQLTTGAIEHLRGRARASQGRWHGRHGHHDRLVYDELCRLSLAAVSLTIEAPTRAISLALTISRESVRLALLRLLASDHISKDKDAAGVNGATWNLDPTGDVLQVVEENLAQGGRTPAGSSRLDLLAHLTSLQALACHDAFTYRALGSAAGSLYATLSPTKPQSIHYLTQATGARSADVSTTLQLLHRHGLASPRGNEWIRAVDSERSIVSQRFATTGVLHERAVLYALEQMTWAWWLAELSWMKQPAHVTRSNQRILELRLTPNNPKPIVTSAFPRRDNGRPSYALAARGGT